MYGKGSSSDVDQWVYSLEDIRYMFSQGHLCWGQERQLSPLPSSMGAGGKKCLSYQNISHMAIHLPILLCYVLEGHLQVHVHFHLSYLVKGHFPTF